jgi:hypothetical protein
VCECVSLRPGLTMPQFQREFAKRLVARPGDALYSRLSVNVNFWATCKHIMVWRGPLRSLGTEKTELIIPRKSESKTSNRLPRSKVMVCLELLCWHNHG